ncbi:MAG: hypothetical protein IJ681_09400 [Bacteroidales bacterium]|nr:hypothetical protein [Bacteroidales bacterium]
MKKTLLALGAVVAMAFGLASCGSTDCTCDIEVLGVPTGVSQQFEDWDGECDEISFSDLDSQTREGLDAADVKLDCSED